MKLLPSNLSIWRHIKISSASLPGQWIKATWFVFSEGVNIHLEIYTIHKLSIFSLRLDRAAIRLLNLRGEVRSTGRKGIWATFHYVHSDWSAALMYVSIASNQNKKSVFSVYSVSHTTEIRPVGHRESTRFKEWSFLPHCYRLHFHLLVCTVQFSSVLPAVRKWNGEIDFTDFFSSTRFNTTYFRI